MKPFKVTKTWLEQHEACTLLKNRFLKKYPRGLTVTRRNLYKVGKNGTF